MSLLVEAFEWPPLDIHTAKFRCKSKWVKETVLVFPGASVFRRLWRLFFTSMYEKSSSGEDELLMLERGLQYQC